MEPFNKSTDAFIKKLKEKADGKTEISMLQHFGRCALDVIAKVNQNLKEFCTLELTTTCSWSYLNKKRWSFKKTPIHMTEINWNLLL